MTDNNNAQRPRAPRPGADEKLMTPTEVAEMLGVGLPWLYQKAQQRTIRSLKTGKHLRFRRTDVERYLDSCVQG